MLFIVSLPSGYVRSTWIRTIRVISLAEGSVQKFCKFPCSSVIVLVSESMVDGCLMKEAIQ